MKQQLDDQIYLSDEEIDLNKKIEDSIKLFFQMYEQFTLRKNYLDLECHNHFQKIRRQLDMHREKIKKKVDEIYMGMIQKTKDFEASYLKLDTHLKYMETKSSIEEKFRNPNLLIESFK